MIRSTALIRIRFPHDLIDRLDRLAERLRIGGRRRIPRAALIRALVQLKMTALDESELESTLRADPVKRGREKGRASRGNGWDQVAQQDHISPPA